MALYALEGSLTKKNEFLRYIFWFFYQHWVRIFICLLINYGRELTPHFLTLYLCKFINIKQIVTGLTLKCILNPKKKNLFRRQLLWARLKYTKLENYTQLKFDDLVLGSDPLTESSEGYLFYLELYINPRVHCFFSQKYPLTA